MSDKLLPCPFCGSKVHSTIAYGASMINCNNENCIMIGCLLDNEPFVDEIEKRWNNRTEVKVNNERLKILTDALLKLAEYWTRANPGEKSHAIYSQIEFIRKLIREECKK